MEPLAIAMLATAVTLLAAMSTALLVLARGGARPRSRRPFVTGDPEPAG